MNSEKKRSVVYSIVIPAYNEEKNLAALMGRIEKTMSSVQGTYEVIIVDNGSYDSTPLILDNLAQRYQSLVAVTLSRNFGYDNAISAGMDFVSGEKVIIMDGDQQDPPEVIPDFINKAKEGYDIVYGIRKKRTENRIIGFQMKLFYRIWKSMVSFNVPADAGNFGIISRRVADIIIKMPEQNKFIRGLRAWTGYPSAGLEYERVERQLGETKFSFLSYLNHAVNGITSFSSFPLRLFTYLGFAGLFLSLVLGGFFFITRLAELFGYKVLFYNISSGFTTLSLITLFSFSVTLLGLGIIGEYVGRIFEEVKKRPSYLISKVTRNGESRINSD